MSPPDLRGLDDCNCLRANLKPELPNGVDDDSHNDLIAVVKVDDDLRHHDPPKLTACTELHDGHSLKFSLAEKLQVPT